MSQKLDVLNYLRDHGPLTPVTALHVLGVYRLAARIHDLVQDGESILTTMKKDAKGKSYAAYTLVRDSR